jgi:hypothetical protein
MQQVLCGDRPADDAEFVLLLETDAEARERWERMRALTGSLDEMGALERAVIGAAKTTTAPGEEQVAARVREELGPRAGGGGLKRWLPFALIAASLALVLLTRMDRSGSDAPTDLDRIVLSSGDAVFSEMSAVAAGAGAFTLEWSDADQSLGRTWIVRFHERDGDRIGAALDALSSKELLEPRWTFTVPAGHDSARLAWSVEARDADGNVAAESSLRALPSP